MSKKKKGGAEAPDAPEAISVAAHPRARASIRRTRARTALAAFGIVLFLSLSSGVPGQEAAVRALVAGLIGNLAGWACALAVWRSLVMAEVKAAGDKHRARVERAAGLVEAERQARADKAATA
jgi:type VI protein secretion system component VasK